MSPPFFPTLLKNLALTKAIELTNLDDENSLNVEKVEALTDGQFPNFSNVKPDADKGQRGQSSQEESRRAWSSARDWPASTTTTSRPPTPPPPSSTKPKPCDQEAGAKGPSACIAASAAEVGPGY